MAADDDLAFDTEKCTVDPVTRIPPCEKMVIDPRVSDAPPEIPDCPDEPLTAEPEPPCPEIRPTEDAPGEVGVTYGGTFGDNPPKLEYFFRRGTCCDFDLDIELFIPCPSLGPDGATKPVPWTSGASRVSY